MTYKQTPVIYILNIATRSQMPKNILRYILFVFIPYLFGTGNGKTGQSFRWYYSNHRNINTCCWLPHGHQSHYQKKSLAAIAEKNQNIGEMRRISNQRNSVYRKKVRARILAVISARRTIDTNTNGSRIKGKWFQHIASEKKISLFNLVRFEESGQIYKERNKFNFKRIVIAVTKGKIYLER